MHVGLDAHKKVTVGFVVRRDGTCEPPFRLPTTKQAVQGLAEELPPNAKVYVEASTTGKAVVRELRNEGQDATLLHPDALLLTLRKNKDDDLDAEHIARVAQLGAYKTAYLPTEEEEELRSLTRHRYAVTERLTALKCRAHAILARNLVPTPPGRLDRPACRKRWEAIEDLPAADRFVLDQVLAEIAHLEDQRDAVRFAIVQAARDDARVRLLLTVPGIDVANAAAIVSELGDPSRFPSAKHAASYAGIVPPNRKSGEKELHGRITKKGSPILRHALVEAAHTAVRYPGRLRRSYRRLQGRIGTKKALVATGRRLVGIVWAMLVRGEAYRDPVPELAERKVWRFEAVVERLDAGDRAGARRLLRTHDLRRDYRKAQEAKGT